MNNLLDLFCKYAVSKGLTDRSFIVGGAVRDLLLNKGLRDVDIVINGDAVGYGKAFSKGAGASFILMDEKSEVARIALSGKYLDICPVRNGSITSDLGERDLTINAMALPLSAYLDLKPEITASDLRSVIIDPYGGIGDLEKGVIRMISIENLISDPLRLLRVYRFACEPGFSIDPATTKAVRILRSLIISSAPERITVELKYILGSDNSIFIINDMLDSGLLAELLPGLLSLPDEVRRNMCSAYGAAEKILSAPALYFNGRYSPIEKYFSNGYRKECLKLAILVGEAGFSEEMLSRLRLSNKEMGFIRLIYYYSKLISALDRAGGSAVMALLKELEDNLYAALVYLVALDSASMSGSPAVKAMAEGLIELYQDAFIPRMRKLPLINGHDLIEQFGLSPSIFFKDILSAVELLVLEGKICNREEALKAAGEMISNKGFRFNP
jgi:tRNA nucleotidyltransferase/poly(A) polymerase